jgi:hypothetical protein
MIALTAIHKKESKTTTTVLYVINEVITHNIVNFKLLVLWAWVSFFAYALTYNVSLIVISKSGNIDGADDSKATLLLPNFETTWQGALFEGHNKKRHPCHSFKFCADTK